DYFLIRPPLRPAQRLYPDSPYSSTAVDYIVRRVKNASRSQSLSFFNARELIVGAASHGSAAQFRNRLFVERAAKRARRENIAVRFVDGFRRDERQSGFISKPRHDSVINVTEQYFGARRAQM